MALTLYLHSRKCARKISAKFERRMTVCTPHRQQLPKLYNHRIVEEKWMEPCCLPVMPQTSLSMEKSKTFEKPENKYILTMFPYPSGTLHMGHVRVYTLGDAIARYQRLRGHQVVFPMGWDAFGLPAENASIERGILPEEWTRSNIAHMKKQLRTLCLSFDWKREIATCDPEYYRWTQSLFLEIYRAGLAYQREAEVNWDPIDQTVLANEQVDANGRSWRSGAIVQKRMLKQWFIGITQFAEPLIKGLDGLKWPQQVKNMQLNWIGKSDGARISFKLENGFSSIHNNNNHNIEVFTSRAETIMGVTFIAIAFEHPIMQSLIKNDPLIASKLEHIYKLKEEEASDSNSTERSNIKTLPRGIDLGLSAIHPLTGRRVPVHAVDYVIAHYSTGAAMGVPGHDLRDFAYARAAGLPILSVVRDTAAVAAGRRQQRCYTGDDGIIVRSGPQLNNLKCAEARKVAIDMIIAAKRGSVAVSYRLRDWLISRQRYWGAPIPIVHCSRCGAQPVPDHELPVLLPPISKLQRTGNPLAGDETVAWRTCKCPNCGGAATRDTDTFDTFMDSSWYFLRFLDPHNSEAAFSPEIVRKWMPVSAYVGGIEHAIMHLLYSRFFGHFLHWKGYLSHPEPFNELLAQGMVCGETYRNAADGRPIPRSEVTFQRVGSSDMPYANVSTEDNEKKLEPLLVTFEKMSKSKHNGVDPQAVVDEYGSDVIRLFILFLGPPSDQVNWDSKAIVGQSRFIQRLWNLVANHQDVLIRKDSAVLVTDNAIINEIKSATAEAILEITDFYEQKMFHLAISRIHILTNKLIDFVTRDASIYGSDILKTSLQSLLIMLSPMAPQVSRELLAALCADTETAFSWPTAQLSDIQQPKNVVLVVQISGKKVFSKNVDRSIADDAQQLWAAVRSHPDIVKRTNGREPRRLVHLPPIEKKRIFTMLSIVM